MLRELIPSTPSIGTVVAPGTGRTAKPRSSGLTMLIDKGLSLGQTEDLLETAALYIDYIKFAFGTALLYPPAVLEAKIAAIREQGIEVYPGGTLYELACAQGKIERFVKHVKALGFTVLEVSEGTIDLAQSDRRRMIDAALAAGLKVVTEIGKKDPSVRLEAGKVVQQVEWDLAAGSHLVIVEGRDTGVGVGAYDGLGRPHQEFVEAVLDGVEDPSRLMWEAPQGHQQIYWIKRLGPNANLGNVQPADVMALEASRQALRGDTMREALLR